MLSDALTWMKKSLDSYKEIGLDEDCARILIELGAIQETLGFFDDAEQSYNRSLQLWDKIGDSIWLSNLYNNLGVLQHAKGDFENSFLNLEKAMGYSRMRGNRRDEGYALASIGDLYKDLDAYDEAMDAYSQSMEIAQNIENQYLVLYLRLAETRIRTLQKQLKQATTLLEIANNQAIKSGSQLELEQCKVEKAILKYYYGDKYTDFSETSIGDMLLDVSAYVGDLLTYNIDYNVNQLLNPTTRIGAISYAKLRGYKPRAAKSSSGLATFTITVPGDEDGPNLNYCPILYSGTQVKSNLNSDKIYELIEDIDFKIIDPKLNLHPIEITKSEVGGSIYYIIQKKGKIVSGATKTFTYTFTTPQKYTKLQIPSNKISEIIEVTDSLNNT